MDLDPRKRRRGARAQNETTTISFSHDDTRNAIANWEIAIKNVPENQKVKLPVYEQALKALKEKS